MRLPGKASHLGESLLFKDRLGFSGSIIGLYKEIDVLGASNGWLKAVIIYRNTIQKKGNSLKIYRITIC